MTSFNSSTTESQWPAGKDPYSRLRHTITFRDGGFARWSDATVGIIGGGAIGGRVAVEAVRSGAGTVFLWDFARGSGENLANQLTRPGESKVDSLARACEEIRPGVLHGFPQDIRHAGIRRWMQCDVMLDCSDDPALAWSLTECSNGTATPLIRCAVDGSGQWELGRVLCSDGAGGRACQVCSYSVDELQTVQRRTPCPGQAEPNRPPTIAGSAISSAIAGLALLQAQRLVTSNDLQRVHDREVIIDLTQHQMLDIQLQRCPQCLSGHRVWQMIEIDATADEITLRELFELAEKTCHAQVLTLAAHQHSFNTQACCDCGCVRAAVGTNWAQTPQCPGCGAPMSWLPEMQIDRVDSRMASDLGILHTPLEQLGIPMDGAMFLARGPGHPLQRLLLRCDQVSSTRQINSKRVATPVERREAV